MAPGNYLSRDQILGSEIKTRDVEAFGGIVCVKELSAKAMDDLLKTGAYDQETGSLDFSKIPLIELCTQHIVDPDTQKPILRRGDVEKLATKGWAHIVTVATAVLELSGIDVETEEQSEEEPSPNG